MWQYRAQHVPWTIHEIIIHITDSEANSYVRCRRFLAEPGSSLMAYDENVWARELDYHAQSPDRAVEWFKWLRKNTYALIRDLPDDVWDQTAFLPENGDMTLVGWRSMNAMCGTMWPKWRPFIRPGWLKKLEIRSRPTRNI
jgi:hypothetical protein